jgi:hypothetical protein
MRDGVPFLEIPAAPTAPHLAPARIHVREAGEGPAVVEAFRRDHGERWREVLAAGAAPGSRSSKRCAATAAPSLAVAGGFLGGEGWPTPT